MKKVAIIFLLLILNADIQAQSIITIPVGDTVTLHIPSHRGSVQWETSSSGLSWIDVLSETLDSLSIVPQNDSTWFRARINEGTCDPIYSSLQLVLLENVSICPPSVSDIAGNNYPVVEIAQRCWMQENLRTDRFQNGDLIPEIINNSAWGTAQTPAWCFFNNDPAMEANYGKYYNFYTIADSRGVCPIGWHVPTLQEWTDIIDSLGGDIVAGGKMKSLMADWASPNTGADNSSGFTAHPGGRRGFGGGLFDTFSTNAEYWTSTENPNQTTDAYFFTLRNTNTNIYQFDYQKYWGINIRCVQD